MPAHDVALKGSGRVELAAYGVADAEHQVEKEVRAAWPQARVEVLEVSRAGAQGRIVEEFAVAYRVRGTVTVEVDDAKEARRTALREVRGRLAGTRHARIAWDPE
jgi:hypothetical protein